MKPLDLQHTVHTLNAQTNLSSSPLVFKEMKPRGYANICLCILASTSITIQCLQVVSHRSSLLTFLSLQVWSLSRRCLLRMHLWFERIKSNNIPSFAYAESSEVTVLSTATHLSTPFNGRKTNSRALSGREKRQTQSRAVVHACFPESASPTLWHIHVLHKGDRGG
jgi:hypothetical protein